MQALLDESEEIQHLTTLYPQQQPMKPMKLKIIYEYFIESIFHYEYEGYETFNKFMISDRRRSCSRCAAPPSWSRARAYTSSCWRT